MLLETDITRTLKHRYVVQTKQALHPYHAHSTQNHDLYGLSSTMEQPMNDKQQKRADKKKARAEKKALKQKKKEEKELAQLRRFAYGDDRVHKHPKWRKTGRFFLKWAFGTGGDGDGRVIAH
jgi:regulator of protease activity HflC (stomatin/prohibitin superfamily)